MLNSGLIKRFNGKTERERGVRYLRMNAIQIEHTLKHQNKRLRKRVSESFIISHRLTKNEGGYDDYEVRLIILSSYSPLLTGVILCHDCSICRVCVRSEIRYLFLAHVSCILLC